jgi:hypothetical protein
MENVSKRLFPVPVNKICAAQKLTIYRDAAYLGEWLEPEVRELYANGLLFPTDYCRREGIKEWQPLAQFLKIEPSRRPSIFRQERG